MKRLLLLISILTLVLLPIGCVDTEGMIMNEIEDTIEELTATYTIKVCSNATGLNFSGEYVVVNAAYDQKTWVTYSSIHTPVEGQVPQEYTVYDVISVGRMFQKQSANGTLEVEIWKGEDLIDSSETADPWGAVSVMTIGEE
jgi:hypothetical protein